MLRAGRRADLRASASRGSGTGAGCSSCCACPRSAATCAIRCARGWRGRASARSAAACGSRPHVEREARAARPVGERLGRRAAVASAPSSARWATRARRRRGLGPRRASPTPTATFIARFGRLRPDDAGGGVPRADAARARVAQVPVPRPRPPGGRCSRPRWPRERAHDLFHERHARWHARSRRTTSRSLEAESPRGLIARAGRRSPRGSPRSTSRTRGSATGAVMICPPHWPTRSTSAASQNGQVGGAHGVQRRRRGPSPTSRPARPARSPRPRAASSATSQARTCSRWCGGSARDQAGVDGGGEARGRRRARPSGRPAPRSLQARDERVALPPPARHSRRAHASAWTRCEPSSWRILRARWAIGVERAVGAGGDERRQHAVDEQVGGDERGPVGQLVVEQRQRGRPPSTSSSPRRRAP